jgi:hypothetical protein
MMMYEDDILLEQYDDASISLDIHDECKHQCRSVVILQYIERDPDCLTNVDNFGYLPLHLLLWNRASAIEDALMIIEKYPAALQHQNHHDSLPLHIECSRQCRSIIISKCVELCPEALVIADSWGYLPLHNLLSTSSAVQVMIMLEKCPATVSHVNNDGSLPLHIECKYHCRSAIISRCIELYPEGLTKGNSDGLMPLHNLLNNKNSVVEDALIMIEKYPSALRHGSPRYSYPLHLECNQQCRSMIIRKCIELYPEALAMADVYSSLPLHNLLENKLSSVDDIFAMIEKYPEALRHHNGYQLFPLHIECKHQCRSSIIAKCIKLEPESLNMSSIEGNLPLHMLLGSYSSSIEDALMMIEKCPLALQFQNIDDQFPIHIECSFQCRPRILIKCIELYPEALKDSTVYDLVHVRKGKFRVYSSVLSTIFSVRPMSLYHYPNSVFRYDMRKDPHYRRRILNLLPRHVFTPTHELDYRDLNWHPRAAMMMLLSRMKV